MQLIHIVSFQHAYDWIQSLTAIFIALEESGIADVTGMGLCMLTYEQQGYADIKL